MKGAMKVDIEAVARRICPKGGFIQFKAKLQCWLIEFGLSDRESLDLVMHMCRTYNDELDEDQTTQRH